MKPLESHSDANTAKKGGGKEPVGGALASYVKQPYPSAGPVRSNKELSGYTGDNSSLGQDGTSVGSYHHQPKTIDPKGDI